MAYNCLLLDLDDTLLSYKESERECLIKVFEKHNIPTTEENIEIFKNINEQLWSSLEQGKIKRFVIDKTRFQKFGQEIGVEIKNSEQVNRDYLGFLRDSAILIDGAIEFLEDIEEFATLAIVTNGLEAVQKNRIKISGLEPFIDGLYTSEKVGTSKPAKHIFTTAIKSLGIENPKKVLVIGDRLNSDIKGGVNAGFDTCWVNFDKQENSTNIQPTYEVYDFTQLKNIIMEGLDNVTDKGTI